jgi:hypothetical protein
MMSIELNPSYVTGDFRHFLVLAIVSYAFTFVIASAGLFSRPRNWLMAKTPWMQPTGHKHFLECRMCIGFWCSLVVCLIINDYCYITDVMAVYGLSYFMATQER